MFIQQEPLDKLQLISSILIYAQFFRTKYFLKLVPYHAVLDKMVQLEIDKELINLDIVSPFINTVYHLNSLCPK